MKKCESKKDFSFMRYIYKHWFGCALYVLSLALFYVGNIFSTICVAQALAYLTDAAYNSMLWSFAYSAIALVIGRLSILITDFSFANLVKSISTEIRNDLTDRMFQINSKSFGENSSGLFVNRIAYSPDNTVDCISELVDTIGNIFASAVSVIYIMVLNVYVGLVIFGVIGGLFVLEYFKVRIYIKNKVKRKKAHDDIVSFSNEVVRSEKDIKSLNLENELKNQSVDIYDKYKNARYKEYTTDVKFWTVRHLVLEIFAFVLVLFSFYLFENEYLAMSAFLFICTNRNQFASVLWSMGRVIGKVADIKVETFRMKQIFDENNFPKENFGDVSIPKNKLKGYIEFKNVKFGYDITNFDLADNVTRETFTNRKKYKEFLKQQEEIKNTSQKYKKPVFENLNFKIPAGKTVAFVGRSGSGKSTILSLIPKLFEVDSGEVLIDGINVKKLSKETLRGSISLVNQFPYIFNKSIRENLKLANNDATDKMLNKALKDASLYDFVKNLKNGLDTIVGENGVKLSGGQKQRLAIARALLKESKIILFDESTSSLDNFAQEDVRKSIEKLKNKTVVIVAHRLSTIKNADIIFFLEKGKIIAKGTFEKLFEKNKKFREMFVAENLG